MNDIATKYTKHKRVFTTNSTSASITEPVATITEPSGTGVIALPLGGLSPNFGELIFFGAGADNATGTAKVYLWFSVGTLWIPLAILNLDITLSTFVGVAGEDVIDTDRFADTLALTAASVNTASNDILSTANNTIARAYVDLTGAAKIEVRTNKGTATNLNALFRGF